MILILSTPTDYDTQIVIDWLDFHRTSFFRLNDEELAQGNINLFYDSINKDDFYIESKKQKIYLKDIKVVWFRKFGFLNEYEIKYGKNSDLVKFLYAEFKGLRTILMELLSNKEWLFDYNKFVSKSEMLLRANKVGLNIPNSLLTSKKTELEIFFNRNNRSIITKPIADSLEISFNDKRYYFHTKKIEDISIIPDRFNPSFFQEYIDKEYELRVFYLDEKCYSMAIFSQNNPLTQVDFRVYDLENPNRREPYKLPTLIETKIKDLMDRSKLNTGSIDLIKSAKNGDYYFLEVNPSGQFGMTGFPCNYNLHNKVAQYLIKVENGK